MSERHKLLTPWQRIVRNAKKGIGVRLSADDVFRLSMDDAISTRAMLDDENDEGVPDNKVPLGFESDDWRRV